jgi:hypothetical protein
MTEEGPLWRPGSRARQALGLPTSYTRTSELTPKAVPLPAITPLCYFCGNTLTEETRCTCDACPKKHCTACHTLLERKGWLHLSEKALHESITLETRQQIGLITYFFSHMTLVSEMFG